MAETRQVKTNSQFGQDVWVLKQLNLKRDGYFIEIGAGDGLWISNTLLMEQYFGWTGLLVEPSSVFDQLRLNRPGAVCENCCIGAAEGEATLFEVLDKGQATISTKAQNNTLLSVVREDLKPEEGAQLTRGWGEFQQAVLKPMYPLSHLLDKHDAPTVIDYFSLDVEGYETSILRDFPFDRYRFRILGIERPDQELHELLIQQGYTARHRLGEDVMYCSD